SWIGHAGGDAIDQDALLRALRAHDATAGTARRVEQALRGALQRCHRRAEKAARRAGRLAAEVVPVALLGEPVADAVAASAGAAAEADLAIGRADDRAAVEPLRGTGHAAEVIAVALLVGLLGPIAAQASISGLALSIFTDL